MRRRHRSIGLLVGLVAAITVASSAAASGWLTIRQQGVSALTQRLDCTENGDGTLSCDGELMAVFKGTIRISGTPTTKSDQVCYERLTATVDAETGALIEGTAATGCALDTHNVRVRSIGSVTLASTRVDLASLTCDENGCVETPAGHLTVRGSWSSAGRALVSRQRFRFDDPICTDILQTQGRARDASFRGFVDGVRMGGGISVVSTGTFRLKTRCLGGLV